MEKSEARMKAHPCLTPNYAASLKLIVFAQGDAVVIVAGIR